MKTLRALVVIALVAAPALASAAGGPWVLLARKAQKHRQEKAKEQAQAKQESPQNKSVTPEAERIIGQTTRYLASLQSFKFKSSAVDQTVSTVARESEVSVVRPNRLRGEQLGATGLAFTYDGKTMSLYCKVSNTYGTVPAPPTLDATIDRVLADWSIEAPGMVLLYSDPLEILTSEVTSGQLIGRESIGGVAANHLAFQGKSVDWQIWVQDGPQPLPLRYVITAKTVKGAPQFAAQFSNWQLAAKLPDSEFELRPPPGAKRVDRLPMPCGTPH